MHEHALAHTRVRLAKPRRWAKQFESHHEPLTLGHLGGVTKTPQPKHTRTTSEFGHDVVVASSGQSTEVVIVQPPEFGCFQATLGHSRPKFAEFGSNSANVGSKSAGNGWEDIARTSLEFGPTPLGIGPHSVRIGRPSTKFGRSGFDRRWPSPHQCLPSSVDVPRDLPDFCWLRPNSAGFRPNAAEIRPNLGRTFDRSKPELGKCRPACRGSARPSFRNVTSRWPRGGAQSQAAFRHTPPSRV